MDEDVVKLDGDTLKLYGDMIKVYNDQPLWNIRVDWGWTDYYNELLMRIMQQFGISSRLLNNTYESWMDNKIKIDWNYYNTDAVLSLWDSLTSVTNKGHWSSWDKYNILLATLADAYEEAGEGSVAECLRCMASDGLKPDKGTFGLYKYSWSDLRIIPDIRRFIPRMRDSVNPVYPSFREAMEAYVEGWINWKHNNIELRERNPSLYGVK